MTLATHANSERMRPNRLLDHLRGMLSSGHYAPGSKFFSNNSLAQQFGISAPTAGKVLDTLCSDGLVQRVKGSGTYVTEQAILQRVRQYALISWMQMGHPALQGSERYQLLVAFEGLCNHDGYGAQVVNLDDPDYLNRLETLLEDGLDGILLIPPFDHPNMLKVVERIKPLDIPVTYWADSEESHPIERAIPAAFDGVQCGRIATEHLLGMGHKQIAAVRCDSHGRWSLERLDGYQQAMADAHIPKHQRHVLAIPDEELTPSKLTGILQQLIKQGITAIFASNDALAYELILAGRAIGIQFPKDLSIIGVDNRGPAILLGLTTIELPATDMANAVLRTFKNSQEHVPVPVVHVPCRLVTRNTVSKPADTKTL
jgi:DNA-binding LacI/PurR family transcriptional regulator